MSNKNEQETKAGHKIPVPKRGDFFDNLKKVAEEKPPKKKSRRGKGRKKK